MYGCSIGEGDGQLVWTVSRKATRRSACHISVFVDPASIGVPSSDPSMAYRGPARLVCQGVPLRLSLDGCQLAELFLHEIDSQKVVNAKAQSGVNCQHLIEQL